MKDDDKYIRSVGGEGILDPSDVQSLETGRAKVLILLLDHDWHYATEILEVSGQREGLRRMRELRKNYTVQRRRLSGSRDFEYRIPGQKLITVPN